MVAFVEPAIVVGDHGEDNYLRFTPGWNDEIDRVAIKIDLTIGGSHGEIRLANADALILAKRLIELVQGQPVHLTIRKQSQRLLRKRKP